MPTGGFDPQMLRIPHVVGAAPVLYGAVLMAGPAQSHFALKGIVPEYEAKVSDTLAPRSLAGLNRTGGLPGIILGSKLAPDTGMMVNANVTVMSPQGRLRRLGPAFLFTFPCGGLFDSGFYDLDDNWASPPFRRCNRFLPEGCSQFHRT